MEKLDCFLGITVGLISFYFFIIVYLRSQGNFIDIPGAVRPNAEYKETISDIPEDTRYKYPYSPPVSPLVKRSTVETVVPANDTFGTPLEETNELLYSGGLGELIKIPLQMNDPNLNEPLRSYDVLVTPYNRIKYSKTC
jgi:hypothetical protein